MSNIMDLKNKNIAVLMGGWNEEKEVSIDSGNAVYNSLQENSYNATKLTLAEDNLISQINLVKPDIVFNALHGTFGEDGQVQSILNYLKVPYTHSGVLPSALAMDKILSSKLVSASNIVKTPNCRVIHKGQNNHGAIKEIGYPLVIKPINSGSSVGQGS